MAAGFRLSSTARVVRRASAWTAIIAAAACASAPRIDGDQRAAAQMAAETLPSLPVSQVAQGTDAGRRIQRFDAVDQDLRTALRGLAESFGLGLDLDPDVNGLVNARLEGVTLEEALASVLARFSYAYQIQGGVLRVTGSRFQSRNFSLDYVSLSRLGSTQTSVTSRLGGVSGGVQQTSAGVSGGIIGGGGGGGGGGVQITSSTAANLWQDIQIALNAIVFYDVAATDSAGVVTATAAMPLPASAANSLLGGAAGAPGATAKTSSDGRRLIINPIAGSIYVTASPATLTEVDAYIRSFEASVQRQVLVEAKIVRVSLNREFRFGIDWSVLGRRANLNLRSGENTSNTVNFTLGGGNSAVTVALHALEAQGDVAVLSSPMITALNNQVAVFDATSDEVFFSVTSTPILGPNGGIVATNTQVSPQQISVGIVLNVLAQIGADNVINLQIRPQLSEVARVEEFVTPEGGKITAPVISRRETDTMARVRGGETIVIGGLTQTRRDRSRTGVPGLSRIPGIGGLFGGRSDVEEKDELVIFLTPTIIVGARTPTP
ncbi:MAG TPA: secretin N-terminal domain-containing protein [Gemmatimonadaceae bacterium]|nr:secretin N-terminal domain-containing protein [Gemmatimonadaceae bacterium]